MTFDTTVIYQLTHALKFYYEVALLWFFTDVKLETFYVTTYQGSSKVKNCTNCACSVDFPPYQYTCLPKPNTRPPIIYKSLGSHATTK